MTLLRVVLVAILGYLLGNIQTGILISKRLGSDVRGHGSGSAGSTNMLRNFGVGPSAITFLGDLLKGVLAAFVGFIIMGKNGAYIGGLLAVVGHNWPALFGFKGGKGIATTAGAILFVQPIVALILLALAAVIIVSTKIVSIASLACCILYFIINLVLNFSDGALVLFSLAVALLAVVTHRENIQRLLKGQEKPISFRKK